MDTVIRVQGLTKRYRKTLAVDDLSFDVPAGSVFAMLGNNGAGKTTTIRCLVGLEEPNAGAVDVLGMSPARDSVAIRRRVGYVPEERHLYEWMTAEEIGWFVGKFYPTWSAERFDAILKHFELPADRKIAKLSRGMKAQLDLALSLAHEPELLVLDEPTGGLDSLVRRDFLESMIAVAGQGRTVLVSSHEVREVERVADHGLILFNSQLLWTGEFEHLKANTAEVLFATDAAPDPSAWPPETVVYREQVDQRTRLVARCGVDDARQRTAGQDGAEVRAMDLEAIFVAYLRGAGYREHKGSLHDNALADSVGAGNTAPDAEQRP